MTQRTPSLAAVILILTPVLSVLDPVRRVPQRTTLAAPVIAAIRSDIPKDNFV